MSTTALIFTIALLAGFSYWLGRKRSVSVVNGDAWKLHSLPSYHGFYTAIWCGIPALIVLARITGAADELRMPIVSVLPGLASRRFL